MADSAISRLQLSKAKFLEEEKKAFYDRVEAYMAKVKDAIMASNDSGDDHFNRALQFFNQNLPEVSGIQTIRGAHEEWADLQDEIVTLKHKISKISSESEKRKRLVNRLEKSLDREKEKRERDIQVHEASLTLVKKNLDTMRRVFGQAVKTTRSSDPDQSGMRATGGTQGQQERGATAASPKTTSTLAPPSSLRKLREFSTRQPMDGDETWIRGMVLLPSEEILVHDDGNAKLKLFNLQGSCLDQMDHSFNGCSTLSVVDDTKVAVLGNNCIKIIQVSKAKIKVLDTIRTERQYDNVIGVSPDRLALGYNNDVDNENFLDLMSLDGRILITLPLGYIDIYSGCLCPDGELVFVDCNDMLGKLDLTTGSKIFHHQVSGVSRPRGVTAKDGHLYVTDASSNSVCLLTPSGQLSATLCSGLSIDKDDWLTWVDVSNTHCVAVTRMGKVFVLERIP